MPRGGFGGAGGGGGGPFGGQDLTQVLSYIKENGGGTLGVSSQSGAGTAVLQGGNVAGIGGFSGRESQVSVSWLADAVRGGRIAWVLTDGDGGFGSGGPGGFGDARVGSRTAMTAVARACRATAASGSGGTLYDCRGRADAIAALR